MRPDYLRPTYPVSCSAEHAGNVGGRLDDIPVPTFPIKTASPARAVPPGRMGYDISADRILLHTIQTKEALDALLSTGELVPDNSLAEPSFADAYRWMLRQMAARLATDGAGALWFWARIRREDLVDCCRQARGEVLLTCLVPRERVLLSNFGDWHSALNRSPLVTDVKGESHAEYESRLDLVLDAFEDRVRKAGAHGRGMRSWPDDLRAEVERSWEGVLDPAAYGRFQFWQGTMHRLYSDDIVEAVRIR